MDTTAVMVLVNIILTALVGFLSSTKFRCRCGRGKSMTMAPKDAPMSPGSITSPRDEIPTPRAVPAPTLPIPTIPVTTLAVPMMERAPTPIVPHLPLELVK